MLMHPINHNRNQHNPIRPLAIIPLHCIIVPSCNRTINSPSRHRAIFPLSRVPSYHHIVPMSLCAILPWNHRAMCLVPSNLPSSIVSLGHVPLCHCILPLWHRAFVPSSHCTILQSYHRGMNDHSTSFSRLP